MARIRYLIVVLILFSQSGWLYAVRPDGSYGEMYRPQFHFSPREGWIGDPDGMMRYQGKYHLFWWGHAVSDDLVYWTQMPDPMTGDDGSFQYFSGSVVPDLNNSSGFGSSGEVPMVAIYTAHERAGGRENQRLSFSTDLLTFQYYDDNPVLDIHEVPLRDPDVFWHNPTRRWIMLVVNPPAREIQFYASKDLKAWKYLSSFGPAGARAQNWEVANLFQLPLDGDEANQKWVLLSGMGPNKTQFFVGSFDGKRFVLDSPTEAYLTNGDGLEGEVFASFESRHYGGWTLKGKVFGRGPAATTSTFSGNLGSRFAMANSGSGRLISQPFKIERNCINFLIGGGDRSGKACINLLVGGRVIRTKTGGDSKCLQWAGWDVSDCKGSQAQIEIVASPDGPIAVDHILFSDVLHDTGREHAHWIDWGPDFYAGRVFRDYDNGGRSDCWIGWLGNWEYANDVPMSWGRGIESIPRSIALQSSVRGYAFVQKPWRDLEKLRQDPVEFQERVIRNTEPLNEFRPGRNTYEIEATFSPLADDQNFGMNFCVGENQKVVLGYDTSTANVYLDRRASGNISFNSRFPRKVFAPLEPGRESITFRVFVDQSSIEVFVNEGEVVISALIFPDPGSRGIQLFSLNGEATLQSLKAWELKSIWN